MEPITEVHRCVPNSLDVEDEEDWDGSASDNHKPGYDPKIKLEKDCLL